MAKKIILLALLLLLTVSCDRDPGPDGTEEAGPSPALTETAPAESEIENRPAAGTESALPDEEELLEDPSTAIADASGEDGRTAPGDTTPEGDRIFNYLNGRTVTKEERDRRPVAIMINNIDVSLPQPGLCDGDIYYECSAEGGITRIMMLVSDYEKLGTVGSVRSSRDYFVDFLDNHDAIYVHAGGSSQAYEELFRRRTDRLDGVNMYAPKTFWRDEERWSSMGMEHSLMTSGKGIAEGIDMMGYRTALDPDYVPMFSFYDEKTDHQLAGSPATHVRMELTPIQTVDFVYDEKTGGYLRYQYDGMPHVDGNTGEQLSVKNVLILFTKIRLIAGDDAGRLSVSTVGEGQGYYITNGRRKVVNWSRPGERDTVHIEYRNGDELILNSGKTFICVADDSVAGAIDFQYEW